MKRLGIFLAVLVVVLAAAVLAVPSLIDWNEYKGEIARRLEAAIGRDVVIEGDLSLSLLPTPTLSADEVAIANVKGGSVADMVTLRSLRLELALAPLFSGEVRIVSLVLVEPVIQLEETASGQRNWELGGDPPAPTPAPAPAPPAESQGGAAVALERMAIENGRLVYLRPGAQPVALEAIDAVVSAESLQGPFKVVGQAGFRGKPLGFELSAGRLAEMPVPLTVAVKLPSAGAEGKLSGQIREQDGVRSFKGRLTLAGNSLAAALGALTAEAQALPQAMSGAFQLEGNMLAGGGPRASLDNLTLRIGESQGGGGLAVLLGETPQVDLALAFNRFDLDDWMSGGKDGFKPVKTAPGEARNAAPPLPERGDPGASLRLLPAERSEAGERGPQPFSLPEGILVNLDLQAESVVVRKALVRQARLNAALSGGTLTLNQASAQLPGGTEVGLFGLLTARGGQPHLEGDVETSSDNLRAALEWMGVDVATVPADRLRKFSASAHVEGRPDEIHVSKLDLRLDTSRLDGALILRPLGRPAFSANLVLDSLNLDAYRGREPKTAPTPAPAAQDRPAGGGSGLAVLGEVDANLRLRLGQIIQGGVTVQDVRIEATLMGGDLTLREVKASDVAGAELRLAGTVRDLPGRPVLDGLEYDLNSENPAKLMRLLGVQAPPRLNGLALAGVLNGTLERLEVKSRSKAAGATLLADGVLTGLPFQPRYDFGIEAEHPNLAALARSLTEGFRPAPGPFALAGRLTGDAAQAHFDDMRLTAGPAALAGQVRVALGGAVPMVTAALTAGEIPLDAFVAPDRQARLEPHPFAGLLLPAAARRTPRGEQLAAAAGPWSAEPVELGWLRDLGADITLDAQAVSWRAWRVERASLALGIGDGAGRLERFTGTLFGGPFQMTAQLAANGALAGQGRVEGAQLSGLLATAAGVDVVRGALTAETRFASFGTSTAAWAANLGGEGRLDVRDGVLQGFDVQRISRQLSDLDNVTSVLGLVQAGLGGGQTPFRSLQATFGAERGVITSRDILIDAQGARVDGTTRIDLPAWLLDTRLEFTLTDHPQAPPFLVRLEGPLDEPRRSFDANQLQAWLVSKGMGRALSGKGGELGKVGEFGKALQGALQRKPAAAPQQGGDQPPPAAPAPAPRVEQQILDGLLKGLTRQP